MCSDKMNCGAHVGNESLNPARNIFWSHFPITSCLIAMCLSNKEAKRPQKQKRKEKGFVMTLHSLRRIIISSMHGMWVHKLNKPQQQQQPKTWINLNLSKPLLFWDAFAIYFTGRFTIHFKIVSTSNSIRLWNFVLLKE